MGEYLSLYRTLEPLQGDFFSQIDRNSPIAYTKGRVSSVPRPHRFHEEDFYHFILDDGISEKEFLIREDFLLVNDTMIEKGDILTVEAYQRDFYGDHLLFVFDFNKQNLSTPQGGKSHV